MPKYTETDLRNALSDIQNGMSEAKAAIVWSVPRNTLRNRIHGHHPRQIGAEHLQRLAPIQEQRLVDWIRVQGTLGTPPNHATIREIVRRMLADDGDLQPLGKKWMEGFFRRNPTIKTMPGKHIESARLKNACPENIRAFLEQLKDPTIAAIPPQHRYNMDEAGIMEGLGVNGLVVGASELRQAYVKEPKRGCWMTFVECISAQGHSINPLVIFNGKSIQQQWFPKELDSEIRGWHFTNSQNGWTSNSHALEWLRKVFIPETKPEDSQHHRLLILDGHGSHATEEFMAECFHHQVRLLYLPAHTSHVLQPLDLSIFSPLKASYRKWARKLSMPTDTSLQGKLGFLLCLQKARTEALTSQNIKSGWRASGLWPLNARKPLRSSQLLPRDLPKEPEEEAEREAEQQDQPFTTPKKREDIKMLMQRLHDSPSSPSFRLATRKIIKAHGELIFEKTTLQMESETLKTRLQLLEPRKRGKVQPNLNEKFVNIEQIMKAREEAEKKAEADRRRVEIWQRDHSPDRVLHQRSFEDMCFEWQL